MEMYVRVFRRSPIGRLVASGHEYSLSDFDGVLPCIGDSILSPGLKVPGSGDDYRNRTMWSVVDRVFDVEAKSCFVNLVVEERDLIELEEGLI